MMTKNPMQLKAFIKNKAAEKHMKLKNTPAKMMKKKFGIWTEKHLDSRRSEAMNHT